PDWAVHGLQKEIVEGKTRKLFRLRARLRIDELKFVACDLLKLSSSLGADANPVEAFRRSDGTIRFNGDFEPLRMHCCDERWVELQQGLSAGADFEFLSAGDCRGPSLCNRIGERISRGEFAASRAIGVSEVGVAEFADG